MLNHQRKPWDFLCHNTSVLQWLFLYHILCLSFCSGLFHYYSLYLKTQQVPSVCTDLNDLSFNVNNRRCLLRPARNMKYLNCSEWINSIFKHVGQENHEWGLFNIFLFLSFFLRDTEQMETCTEVSCFSGVSPQQSHIYLLLVSGEIKLVKISYTFLIRVVIIFLHDNYLTIWVSFYFYYGILGETSETRYKKNQ